MIFPGALKTNRNLHNPKQGLASLWKSKLMLDLVLISPTDLPAAYESYLNHSRRSKDLIAEEAVDDWNVNNQEQMLNRHACEKQFLGHDLYELL